MIDHLDKIYGEKKESVEKYKKLYSVKDLNEKIKAYKGKLRWEGDLDEMRSR